MGKIVGRTVVLCCLGSWAAWANEPVIGGPCESCEAVFVDLPLDLKATARIAPTTEPGQPLVLEGTVRTASGTPVSGIIVYAYHTNAGGIYPKAATAHGSLRAWVRTDGEGSYRFDTIRPGAYPGRRIPEHIHVHVIEPGRATYFIEEVTFADDALLTAEDRRRVGSSRGGVGLTTPTKDSEGRWRVRREIILGEAIPGYDGLPPLGR